MFSLHLKKINYLDDKSACYTVDQIIGRSSHMSEYPQSLLHIAL